MKVIVFYIVLVSIILFFNYLNLFYKDMLNLNIPTSITKINSDFLQKKSVRVFIKRDDLIHDIISGNKWRKLKYNLENTET